MRHERARQQESARQGIVAQLAEQRTIEAQARHREKLEAAAAAREQQQKEYEQAQIAAWHEVRGREVRGGAAGVRRAWGLNGRVGAAHPLPQHTAAQPHPSRTPSPPTVSHLQAQELQEAARRRLEEEQRAAVEAEATAWEASRHQREVAALLERSAELRELKQKLQAAEVNLERSQQREQRAAIETREREYEAALQATMAAARQEAAVQEAAEAEARQRLGQEARQALDAQLQERSELQRVARVGAGCWEGRGGERGGRAAGRAAGRATCCSTMPGLPLLSQHPLMVPPGSCSPSSSCFAPLPQEEFEKERAAVDAVVARIEEEERAAEQARARQRQVAQADIARFLAQQQELKRRWAGDWRLSGRLQWATFKMLTWRIPTLPATW